MFWSIVLALLIVFINVMNIRRRNRGKMPKGHKASTLVSPTTFPEDLTRDRFLLKKVPEHIDVIVIGSGISGLTSAAILSKIGKKVLVIEQHYVAGGNLHAFTDKGYEFETGLHYINANDGKSTGMRFLDLLTTSKIEWAQLGRENPDKLMYDKVYIGTESFEFISGKQKLIASLKSRFPSEAKGIDTYFSEVVKARSAGAPMVLKILNNGFLYRLFMKLFKGFWLKYMTQSVHDVIAKCTKDRKLEAILCTQFGDYGLDPMEAPFFIHAGVVNHYLEGAHFPVGGPQEIARELIGTIYSHGGKVLVAKKVNKILTDETATNVLGIEMETGDVIGCSTVISSVGFFNTYEKLLPSKFAANQMYKSLKENVKSTSHCVILFVGMKGSVSELKLPSHNVWSYPHERYEEWFPKFKENPLENEGFYFIGFGSSKDSDWEKRFTDRSTGIVITFMKRDLFNEWETQEVKHRDKAYKTLKEKLIQKMLDEGLYKYYPHLKEHVDYLDLGTPLSCEHFLGAFKGGIYGLDCSKERYIQYQEFLNPKTNIRGFYMSGQDITSAGVVPSMLSGIVTCSQMLDYGVWDLIAGRNLLSELKNLNREEKKQK